MCLGIPGQVVEVGKTITENAMVDVCGVKREVNIALVCEGEPHTMIGKWVLVHVGFAMSIVNEEEAKETLDALMAMGEVEDDVSAFLYGEEGAPQKKIELILYYCMINFFFLYLNFIFGKLGRPSFLSLYSGDDPNLSNRGSLCLGSFFLSPVY